MNRELSDAMKERKNAFKKPYHDDNSTHKRPFHKTDVSLFSFCSIVYSSPGLHSKLDFRIHALPAFSRHQRPSSIVLIVVIVSLMAGSGWPLCFFEIGGYRSVMRSGGGELFNFGREK